MSRFTYANGRYYKDGRPFFVIASDYQYYRDQRDHWPDRLTKLKEGGVNVITFYTPWRHHLQWDAGRRWYDFEGKTKDSRDLVGYLELIQTLGLYMIVKPGPFVHSELNVGGLPDLVEPTLNPEIPAARRHHGGPAMWSYDASVLPSPMDECFDALVAEWLGAVGRVIAPYAEADGPVIGLQLNDETIYCTSNDPPWHIGYETAGMRFFHKLLAERYGDVANYNRLHGTEYRSFEFVPGPRLEVISDDPRGKSLTVPAPGANRREDVLRWIDWAEYQWRLRRDLYVRYEQYLGIGGLPFLTNYAGITPVIEENVPDFKAESAETIPLDYAPLYPEWWFAMNRVDHDRDAYEYGMISWLGVAAYDRDVFDRYVNTARRARGINMEENWGFGMLYDERSRYPVIPFFQTLVSLAAGATGYDVFVGVSTGYWDDSLDRITKLQCETFPSHAPIDEHGRERPMYYTMKMLGAWFAEHGEALLECEPVSDVGYLLYAPYAAVSSWVPDERYWRVKGHAIPRCGHQGFEEFSHSMQRAGFGFSLFELDAATDEQMRQPNALAIHSAFFMDASSQEKLANFIDDGGRLFISGELPVVDLQFNECTRLKDAIEADVGQGNVIHRSENFFAGGHFADELAAIGKRPHIEYSHDMRAFVHKNDRDTFVFFFNFESEGSHKKSITFFGHRLDLVLGSKTSGVVRITDGQITGYLVKGENEVERIKSDVRIQLADQVIEGHGDFSSRG